MEQQTNSTQTVSKEENVKSAIEDIALIKRIIDRSEINMHRLGWLFLVYGLVTFAFTVFRSALTVILSRVLSIQAVSVLNYIFSGLSLAVMIALFVLFLRKRGSMVKNESVYTMKLFDMWGVMLFVPVVLGLAPMIIGLIGSAFGMSEYTVLIYNVVFSIMKYSAVCMCIFFTGHYISSWFMKILSLALFILLPVMSSFSVPFIDGTSLDTIGSALELYAYFSVKTALASIILTLVYIVMGIVFLVKQRGSAYGNE